MPDIKHFNPDIVLDEVVQVFWRQGMPTTGIQALVTATGVSRSSLYATFGNKEGLFTAALDRYIAQHSTPAFAALSQAPAGLTSIEEFFAGLIGIRCSGAVAGWGCMVTNAHAGPECADPAVRDMLQAHHTTLQAAMRSALATAADLHQLRPATDLDAAAAVLSTLAYGVNLRSRAGADAETLTAAVSAALAPLRAHQPPRPHPLHQEEHRP
ncbi:MULTISPECIES: TetR/AcrR family transcriptional regulator [unclassified Streptomyces]|uniref:TetR/AcrR family transcriptional regulator n=1 Tax=unclassified Streptomyces TaxID=2593676 RepID=UPI0038006E78